MKYDTYGICQRDAALTEIELLRLQEMSELLLKFNQTGEVPSISASELTCSEQFEKHQQESRDLVNKLQNCIADNTRLEQQIDHENYKAFKESANACSPHVQDLLDHLSRCEAVMLDCSKLEYALQVTTLSEQADAQCSFNCCQTFISVL